MWKDLYTELQTKPFIYDREIFNEDKVKEKKETLLVCI